MQISYSKRARGTSANKEFGLRRESGLWRGNLFPFFAIASNFKLIVPARLGAATSFFWSQQILFLQSNIKIILQCLEYYSTQVS